MSAYQVAKFLYHFNRHGETRARFAADPDATLGEYDLSEDERAALVGQDFRKLYSFGIHPLLLTPFANYTGIPVPQYLEAIRRTDPS